MVFGFYAINNQQKKDLSMNNLFYQKIKMFFSYFSSRIFDYEILKFY